MSSETCEYVPGDWVRFYRNGVLVVGVVQYATYNSLNFMWNLHTDVGSVSADQVLEVRR